jgi:hypothetical protein
MPPEFSFKTGSGNYWANLVDLREAEALAPAGPRASIHAHTKRGRMFGGRQLRVVSAA